MKIGIVSKSEYRKEELQDMLREFGCRFSTKDPDYVVSWGGDGTFLMAERYYPGIPKILVRDSRLCLKCNVHDIEQLAEKMEQKRFKFHKFSKLEFTCNKKKKYLAVNDIILRNKNLQQAIRYNVFKNGKKMNKEEIIGDGLVIATTFGSTAYYNSLTRKTFNQGAGIAFNNTTIPMKPLSFRKGDKIRIQVTRGPAELGFDNSPDVSYLKDGESFSIRISDKKASIVRFN